MTAVVETVELIWKFVIKLLMIESFPTIIAHFIVNTKSYLKYKKVGHRIREMQQLRYAPIQKTKDRFEWPPIVGCLVIQQTSLTPMFRKFNSIRNISVSIRIGSWPIFMLMKV